jgi:SAM-dependent methyltransferase
MSRHLADRGVEVSGVDLSPGMISMARRDHPDLEFQVGSLVDLPFPAGQFTGVMLWYSIIHTAPDGLRAVVAEVARVLRPTGHVLVGFQAGEGTRDVSASYRRFGHEVRLERHLHVPDQVTAELADGGLRDVARLVRGPRGGERDDQAFLLAQRG